MNPLRIAVIGVGALGQHHARILSQFEGVKLIGVADLNESQGRKVAQSAHTDWVADYRLLLGDVDAVTIAVPTAWHRSVATTFLENGIPALVEKPLAGDLDSATQLVELAAKTGTILQVGHIERFNPAFQSAARLCQSPKYIRAERLSPFPFRSTDISVVHDVMIHDLDLVLSLVDSPVARVEALGFTLIADSPDAVQARLTFANGCVADFSASRIHPAMCRVTTIWTTSRCITVDYVSRKVTTYAPLPRLLAGPSPIELARRPGADIDRLKQQMFGSFIEVHEETAPSADLLTIELQEFVDCVRDEKTPTVSGATAMQAVSIAEQILSAMQQPESATQSLLPFTAAKAA